MEYYGPTSVGIICFEQAVKYTSTKVDIFGCDTPITLSTRQRRPSTTVDILGCETPINQIENLSNNLHQ